MSRRSGTGDVTVGNIHPKARFNFIQSPFHARESQHRDADKTWYEHLTTIWTEGLPGHNGKARQLP